MTKLGQDRRQRQFTPSAAHSTGYPPALRGALLVMAAAAAAGALYGVVRAEHYLNSPTRWSAFGIGVMAVTAVLAAGLRYRTFGGYIVAVSLSMIVSVYAAEAVLWLKLPPQLPVDLGDLRQAEELELLARAAAEGRKLVPALSKPTLLSSRIAESSAAWTVGGQDAIKLGGIASAPTLFYDAVNDRWTEVMSDRYGHRNPDDVWDHAPIDALVVGASHAAGAGASLDHDFVTILDDGRHRVARLAIGGASDLLKLGMLREYGPALAPKVVFWIYSDRSDLGTSSTAGRSTPLLKRYLDPAFSQDLIGHEHELSRQLEIQVAAEVAAEIARSRTAPAAATPVTASRWRSIAWDRFVRLDRVRARLGLVGTPVTAGEVYAWQETMAAAQRDVSAWGGQLVFVYTPLSLTLETRRDERFKPAVVDAINRLAIPLLDTTPVFFRAAQPLDYVRLANGGLGNHYNDEGHRLLAQCLAGYLYRVGAGQEAGATC